MSSSQSETLSYDVSEIALNSPELFSYSPLDPTIDCIRLIIIEPSEPHKDIVSCRLQHVPFAQKPKYEALCYTWGDQAFKERILLDGKSFEVGRNLIHALRNLQGLTVERIVWIDAICIDQSNVSERNRQLSIMPHIYRRAIRVIISLYYPRKEQPDLPSGSSCESVLSPENTISSSPQLQNYRRLLLQDKCRDEYWKRVWVIQECSLARQLQVQYGELVLGWKRFIAVLKLNGEINDSRVPLMFQKQMEQRYVGGHKLCNLLQAHQDALCKVPHDKVYGFVGLARDTVDGFPMDYKKTLFDVWVDTIWFQNADRESSQYDIIPFSRLVKKLLGGPIASDMSVQRLLSKEELDADHPSQEKRQPFIPDGLYGCLDTINLDASTNTELYAGNNDKFNRSTRDRNKHKLFIPARIIGRICHLGPTYNEIISDLKKSNIWRASIDTHIPRSQRARAREESNLFLTSLEELEDDDLKKIKPYNSQMNWEIGSGDPALRSMILRRRSRETTPIQPIFNASSFDWEGEDTNSHGEPIVFAGRYQELHKLASRYGTCSNRSKGWGLRMPSSWF